MRTFWNFLLFAFPLAVLLGVVADIQYDEGFNDGHAAGLEMAKQLNLLARTPLK